MTLDKVLVTILLAASLAGASKSPASGIIQQIANECRSVTGSDEAFRQLKHDWEEDILHCFNQNVNMSFLLSSVNQLSKQEQSLKLKEICGQVQNSLSCIDPLINKLDVCVNDPIGNAVEKLQKIVDTLPEVSSLVCNNSAVKQRQSLESKQVCGQLPGSFSCIGRTLQPIIDKLKPWISEPTPISKNAKDLSPSYRTRWV
ncbi:uncharacterized protein LOC129720966 [Wyeomyia smithii]|uniref:uncharacterized protein LOC129720966 n=1 Tax=Wyeomyia smithii TaxID=174621 RepID=UPI002467EC36|nr:uncharacterized protein LOC129720966 [Wyeomyia smithii]